VQIQASSFHQIRYKICQQAKILGKELDLATKFVAIAGALEHCHIIERASLFGC
jgi:hypothetical protein